MTESSLRFEEINSGGCFGQFLPKTTKAGRSGFQETALRVGRPAQKEQPTARLTVSNVVERANSTEKQAGLQANYGSFCQACPCRDPRRGFPWDGSCLFMLLRGLCTRICSCCMNARRSRVQIFPFHLRTAYAPVPVAGGRLGDNPPQVNGKTCKSGHEEKTEIVCFDPKRRAKTAWKISLQGRVCLLLQFRH